MPIMYLRERLSDRNFIIVSSILVGLTSGLAAVLLKLMVHGIETVVRHYSHNFENILLFAAFPMVGIVLAVLYQRFMVREKIGKGTSEIVYSILKKQGDIAPAEMHAHLVSSGLTVGFGGSAGLESPMVSTGAAIGSNYSRHYRLTHKDKTLLIGCGAAAGIAAAFNAPVAGVLFAIEVLLTQAATASLVPLLIAAATGALVSKITLSEGLILSFSLKQPFDYHNLFFYILLGIVCGFVSLMYTYAFARIDRKLGGMRAPWLATLLGGTILFILVLVFPPLFGEGYETIKSLSTMDAGSLADASVFRQWIRTDAHLLIFLSLLIIFKIVAAAVTIGSGGNGGSFAPSLFIGAYVGYVFSGSVNLSGVMTLPQSNFTIVAMAGILSGVFYAPLTAIFLIVELTGGYDLMIPLMIVASLSMVVTRLFHPLSPESRKLSRRLKVRVDGRDTLLLSRLDLTTLIEKDFLQVHPDDKLSILVKAIVSSRRNTFPVVGENGTLEGVIHLDNVRNVIFDTARYDELTVGQLMTAPAAIIDSESTLHDAVERFDQTGQWNLPVVGNGKYIGFLSKSSILTRYRKELLESA